MRKNSSDLLLFELGAPVEDDAVLKEDNVGESELQPLEGKSKRAMNRSLLGIMEQERSYDAAGKFVHEAADSASHSYF